MAIRLQPFECRSLEDDRKTRLGFSTSTGTLPQHSGLYCRLLRLRSALPLGEVRGFCGIRSLRARHRGLRNLIPATVLKLVILETPAKPSIGYVPLLTRWDGGERKMAQAVRSALINGSTFGFVQFKMITV
jgi:hypothetical protein